MAISELEEMFRGEYVEINYYDNEGNEVIIAGKVSKLKVSSTQYSTCIFNPVVINDGKRYTLKKTKKNIAYFIPPGGLNKIEPKTRKEIIKKCCQINESEEDTSERTIIRGFQLLKDRKNLEETCNPSD
jgi:hypothetical protein